MLRDVLWQWLEHRNEVLVRRSKYPPEEDRASPRSARRLSDRLPQHRRGDPDRPLRGRSQGEADVEIQAQRSSGRSDPESAAARRCRGSKRVEIKAEHDKLSEERRELKRFSKSEELQWERVAAEVKETREKYSKKTALGRRRSTFADAPEIDVDLDAALVEKEPITVILSEKGWVRALKGHPDDLSKLEFKQGDEPEARGQGARRPTSS